MFFDKYPEFVDLDVRNNRPNLTITIESLSKRCEAILTPGFINNKSILDLGSATGAMGHYALCNGAANYTGVEIQQPYRDLATNLLSTYHKDNWSILKSIDDVASRYDIVLACGIIHSFVDVFGILKTISALSNKYIVLETNNPDTSDVPVITFNNYISMISTKGGEFPRYLGLAALPNKAAIDLIMSINGFKELSRIYPAPIINSHDGYSDPKAQQHRFISKYIKDVPISTLETTIRDDNLAI